MGKNIAPLDVIVLEPKHCSPKYTLFWSNGICTTYTDYMLLLEPIADAARVVAYNYRDHGRSRKRFSPTSAVGDLERLVRGGQGPVFLAGHCTGAAVSSAVKADVKGRVLLCPYLGTDYLAAIPKIIMKVGRFLPLCYMDRLISYAGLAKFFGVENSKPLQDVMALRRFQPASSDPHAMWMVSPRDEVLGTIYSSGHYDCMRSRLRDLYPHGVDKSRLVTGLTHSLNVIPGHLIPFLSACPSKRRQRIVDAIIDYCDSRV